MSTQDRREDVPDLPMDREPQCPFDPPTALKAMMLERPTQRVRLWDGSEPWIVTKFADQRAILSDPKVSADGTHPGYPHTSVGSRARRFRSPSILSVDDPDHETLRRALMPFFTVKRVEALRPRIQEIVDSLIDDMLARPSRTADLVRDLALPVPTLMVCELFGMPYDDHEFMHVNTQAMVSRVVTADQALAAIDAVSSYARGILEERTTSPRDDLMTHLAVLVGQHVISMKQAVELALQLVIAGHDTTANMISLGALVLLEHPEQRAELVAAEDPKIVLSAVEELLRYLTINHNGRRRVALDEIQLGDETIHAGDGIICAQNIGNRDPEVFAEPDRFDIHRNPRNHIAFGFGVHQCIGQPLARVELQVVYKTLFRRIPSIRLASELSQVPFKNDQAVYGVYELPVRWD